MDGMTRLCGARTKESGEPCRRPAIRGGNRCNHHGGHTPLARQTAQENLAKAALPSSVALLDIVSDWRRHTCETCGFPRGEPSPVIRAAQIILDRTGYSPHLTVHAVRAPEIPDWASWLTDDELSEVSGIIEKAKLRLASGADREDTMPNNNNNTVVTDGVLVETESDDAVLVDDETETEAE